MTDVHVQRAAERVLDRMRNKRGSRYTDATLLKHEIASSTEGFTLGAAEHSMRMAESAKRILMCSTSTVLSGGDKVWLDLITHLDRAVFAQYVVLPCDSILSRRIEATGIRVRATMFDFSAVAPRSVKFFDDLFAAPRIDLVHINGFGGVPLIIAALNAGVRIVWHVHTRNIEHIKGPLQFADRVISVSHAAKRSLLRWGLRPEKVIVVRNGIDLDVFKPGFYSRSALREYMELPEDARVISMVARIEQRKRIDLMFSALPGVMDRLPNTILVIAGETHPGTYDYHAKLRQIARILGIDQNVVFLGFVDDIRKVYAVSDVLVSCSEEEALPTCILEAMAMGVPVIAPDTSGYLELVADGKEGILYESGDVAALEEVVLRVLKDDAMRCELSMHGQEKARLFDIREHVRRIEDVYMSLVS